MIPNEEVDNIIIMIWGEQALYFARWVRSEEKRTLNSPVSYVNVWRILSLVTFPLNCNIKDNKRLIADQK